MIRGSVCHPERRSRALVDAVGDSGQTLGRHRDLFGERAEHLSSCHSVADGESACLAAHFDDDARELAADDERCRDADLVLVRDEKDVGVVDRCGADSHPYLPGFERLCRLLLDPDDLRRPVFRADCGASHL